MREHTWFVDNRRSGNNNLIYHKDDSGRVQCSTERVNFGQSRDFTSREDFLAAIDRTDLVPLVDGFFECEEEQPAKCVPQDGDIWTYKQRPGSKVFLGPWANFDNELIHKKVGADSWMRTKDYDSNGKHCRSREWDLGEFVSHYEDPLYPVVEPAPKPKKLSQTARLKKQVEDLKKQLSERPGLYHNKYNNRVYLKNSAGSVFFLRGVTINEPAALKMDTSTFKGEEVPGVVFTEIK